ncbi:MAG TPA: hypothetical protein VHX88_21590 [Solirubrobacteraceae bacterium]|nr:hypothetical protein [Solirubrobacteraceae bacterium]
MAYHVELSRGLFRSSQLFNLDLPELEARILTPWRAGGSFEIEDKLWVVAESKITILHGPGLEPSQLAMGQGWRAAVRSANDVTATVLAAPGAPAVPSAPASASAPAASAPAVPSAPGAPAPGPPAPPGPSPQASHVPSPPGPSAPSGATRRVLVGGGPDQRALDAVAAFVFALDLEPVRWRPGPPEPAQALLVAVGPAEDGTLDPGTVLLAGVAAGAAPGRALALERDGAALPEPGAVPLLPAVKLDDAQAPARIADWLESVGCPVRREEGWDDPGRFR